MDAGQSQGPGLVDEVYQPLRAKFSTQTRHLTTHAVQMVTLLAMLPTG